MPIIGSRALMSGKGFGQFAPTRIAPGSIALIIISNSYYKYTFALDSVIFQFNAGVATLATNQACAISNADKGWFTVRSNQTGFLYTELRYWAAYKGFKNVNLVPGVNTVTNAGAGNGAIGVMTSVANDTVPATTSVISYATNTISAGTTLGGPCETGAATASPTYALFTLMGASLPQTNKYGFADNSVSPGTNLTFNISVRAPSIGNAAAGIFCQGGNTISVTCKYVYSSNTCSPSTTLLRPTTATRAFNNDVVGLVTKGGSSVSSPISSMLWSFADDSIVASTVTTLGQLNCGTANGIPGLSA